MAQDIVDLLGRVAQGTDDIGKHIVEMLAKGVKIVHQGKAPKTEAADKIIKELEVLNKDIAKDMAENNKLVEQMKKAIEDIRKKNKEGKQSKSLKDATQALDSIEKQFGQLNKSIEGLMGQANKPSKTGTGGIGDSGVGGGGGGGGRGRRGGGPFFPNPDDAARAGARLSLIYYEHFQKSSRDRWAAWFAGLGTALAGGVDPWQQLVGNITKDTTEWRVNMRLIAFETQGITGDLRGMQGDFIDIGKSVARTGVSLDRMQNSYLKNIKKGIKNQHESLEVLKAGLATGRLLGMDAEQTADVFHKWHMTLALSSNQTAQIGRGMQDVARTTGVTGEALQEVVNQSEQFMHNMANAGTLTSSATKQIMTLTASLQKRGVGEEFNQIMNAATSTTKLLLESGDESKRFLYTMAGRAGRLDDLISGTLYNSKGGMRTIANEMESFIADMGYDLENLDSLSEKELRALNVSLKMKFGIESKQYQKIWEAHKEGSQTLEESLSKLDSAMKNNNLTAEEKLKLEKDQHQLMLNSGFEFMNIFDEQAKIAGRSLTEAAEMAVAKMKPDQLADLETMGKQFGLSMNSAADKWMAAGLVTAKELAKAGGKDFTKDLQKAIRGGDARKTRSLLEEMNAEQQKIATTQKAGVDPIEDIAQDIRVANEYLRQIADDVAGGFLDMIGKSGLMIMHLSSMAASLYLAFAGTRAGEMLGKFASNSGSWLSEAVMGQTMSRQLGVYGKLLAKGKFARAGKLFMGGLGSTAGSAAGAASAAGGTAVSAAAGTTGMTGALTGGAGLTAAGIGTAAAYVLPPLVASVMLLVGAVKGWREADKAGRTKWEGAMLGALTGSAGTSGGMIGRMFGTKEGTSQDKAAGVAGAGLWGGGLGAALGATIGTFIAPGIGTAIGAAIGVVVGGLLGIAVQFLKIVTEGTKILTNLFAPVTIIFTHMKDQAMAIWDVFAGIATMDLGRVFKGVFNYIGTLITLVPKLVMASLKIVFITLPSLLMKTMATVLLGLPKLVMDSIKSALESLASNEWVGPIFETLSEAFNELYDAWMTIYTPLKEASDEIFKMFEEIGEALFGFSSDGSMFKSIIRGIAKVIGLMLKPLVALAKMLGFFLRIIGSAVAIFTTAATGIWKVIKGILTFDIDSISEGLSRLFIKLPGMIINHILRIPMMIIGALKSVLVDLPMYIFNAVTDSLKSIGNWFSSMSSNEWVGPIFQVFNDVFAEIYGIWNDISEPIMEAFGELGTAFSELYDAFTPLFDLFGLFGGEMPSFMGLLKMVIRGIATGIAALLQPLVWMAKIIRVLMSPIVLLAQGVAGAMRTLKDSLEYLLSWLPDWMKSGDAKIKHSKEKNLEESGGKSWTERLYDLFCGRGGKIKGLDDAIDKKTNPGGKSLYQRLTEMLFGEKEPGAAGQPKIQNALPNQPINPNPGPGGMQIDQFGIPQVGFEDQRPLWEIWRDQDPARFNRMMDQGAAPIPGVDPLKLAAPAIPGADPLRHAVPVANQPNAVMEPVHMNDIAQDLIREKVGNGAKNPQVRSDELTRMDAAMQKSVELLSDVSEGIRELVSIFKPGAQVVGNDPIGVPQNRLRSRPKHTPNFATFKYGYPGGNANRAIINDGDV